MSFVGPRTHGLLDYLTVVVFLAAPGVLGFTGLSAGLCYGLAVVHLLLTLLTDFPLGVRGTVPLRAHRAVEVVVGLALVVGPWIPADAILLKGRVFFGVVGAAIVAMALGTGRRPKERKERKERTQDAVPDG